MTSLAPHFFWIGFAVSSLVVALHFIVTKQPKSEAFPTARFVPDSPVEAVSRATRPSDLLILLLRVLAIMSITAAFARPILSPARQAKARIILADISRSSQSLVEVRDSAKKYFRAGDILVGFDSVPRVLELPDSIVQVRRRSAIGNISAALVSAIRASTQLREHADSVSLVLVSALPAAALDPATDTIRSLWPGAIEIVRVAPNHDSESTVTLPVRTAFAAGDPLNYSVELASKLPHAREVRVIRSGAIPVATGDSGEVMLHWPVSERPRFARSAPAAVQGGLIVGKTVIVAPFRTEWEFPADSLKGAKVIGRWANGDAAIVQRDEGTRCVRSANIPISSRGDLVIRPEFVAIVQSLLSPCDPDQSFAPANDAAVMRLKGGTAAAARTSLPAAPTKSSPYKIWLFLAAIALLGVEQFARRAFAQNIKRAMDADSRIAA